MSSRRASLRRRGWTVIAGLGLVVSGCTSSAPADLGGQARPAETAGVADTATADPTTSATTPEPSPSPSVDATPTAHAVPTTVATPTPEVLTVVDPKDGDSFVASDGVEYRVGLINAPELSACGGPEAADRAEELLAAGFTVEAYADDQYGRAVARIRLVDGRDFGVTMAEEGMADDRYLEEFRHEHPAYAAELDGAFAAARHARAGLWQTCWSAEPVSSSDPRPSSTAPAAPPETIAPQPLAGGTGHGGATGRWPCHPDYYECLPDGPDLDCGEVRHQVTLLGEHDPYRLDGNNTHRTDGLGCETYPPWDPSAEYDYYG